MTKRTAAVTRPLDAGLRHDGGARRGVTEPFVGRYPPGAPVPGATAGALSAMS
jgi:hypothetical protein